LLSAACSVRLVESIPPQSLKSVTALPGKITLKSHPEKITGLHINDIIIDTDNKNTRVIIDPGVIPSRMHHSEKERRLRRSSREVSYYITVTTPAMMEGWSAQ